MDHTFQHAVEILRFKLNQINSRGKEGEVNWKFKGIVVSDTSCFFDSDHLSQTVPDGQDYLILPCV